MNEFADALQKFEYKNPDVFDIASLLGRPNPGYYLRDRILKAWRDGAFAANRIATQQKQPATGDTK